MDEDNFLNEILHDINLEKELKLQLPENHDQNNFDDDMDKNSEKYTKKRSFDTILSLLDDGLFLPSNLDVNLSNFDDIEMDVMSDIKIGNLNNTNSNSEILGKMDVEEILSLKNLEMSTREGQNQKIEKDPQQNKNQNSISNAQKLTPKMKRNYHCDDLCEQNSTKTELTSGFGSIYEYGYNNVEDWLEMNIEHMSEENAQKLTAESEAETKNLHSTQEIEIQTSIQPMISCNQNPSIINLDRIGCGAKSCSAIGPTSNTSIIRYDCTYPIQPITLSNSSSLNFTPIDYNYKQTDFSQNPELLAPQISLDTLKKQNSGKNSRNKIPNRQVPMNSNRPIIISYLPNYNSPHVMSNSNFTVVSYVNDNPYKQNIMPNLPKNKEKKNEEKENFKIKQEKYQSKLPLEMDLDELTNKIYDLPPELNNPLSKDYDPEKIDLHEKNYFEDTKIVNSKTNFSKWQTIMEVVYPNSPITDKVAQEDNNNNNVLEKEASENDDMMEEVCSNLSAQINKIRKVQPLTKTDGTKRLPTLRKIELDGSKSKKRKVSYHKNNHVTNNNSFVNLQPLTIQPIHSTTSRRIIKGSDNISYEEIYFYDDNKNLCKALCPLPRKINNHSKSTKSSKLSSHASGAGNNLQMGWSHHKKIVNQGQEVHMMGRT